MISPVRRRTALRLIQIARRACIVYMCRAGRAEMQPLNPRLRGRSELNRLNTHCITTSHFETLKVLFGVSDAVWGVNAQSLARNKFVVKWTSFLRMHALADRLNPCPPPRHFLVAVNARLYRSGGENPCRPVRVNRRPIEQVPRFSVSTSRVRPIVRGHLHQCYIEREVVVL